MADVARAKEMLVPDDNVFLNSGGYQRRWLVLHKTGGGSSARAVAQWFQNGAGGNRTSVHHIVGLDGEFVQCVREKDGAAGNCCLEPGSDSFWPRDVNLNLVTFSIEAVDPALDNSTPMPPAQKQSLFWLVEDLCTRRNIAMRPADATGGIAGHNSIAPRTRSRCPGNFPWGELWEYLRCLKGVEIDMLQLTDPMGSYFQQVAPDRWRCRNGIELSGKALTFYRRHSGAVGLPLTAPVTPVRYPQAKLIVCEAGIIADDPSGSLEGGKFPSRGNEGCYLIHLDGGIGQEVIAHPVVAAIQQENAQLKAKLAERDPDVVEATKQAMRQIKAIATQFSEKG